MHRHSDFAPLIRCAYTSLRFRGGLLAQALVLPFRQHGAPRAALGQAFRRESAIRNDAIGEVDSVDGVERSLQRKHGAGHVGAARHVTTPREGQEADNAGKPHPHIQYTVCALFGEFAHHALLHEEEHEVVESSWETADKKAAPRDEWAVTEGEDQEAN